MKSVFVFILSLIFISSCQKYEQPKLLSLSGEYRIDKVTYEQTDNTSTGNQMVYYPGQLYVNPSEVFPMDSIAVGFTSLHMDYSIIRFKPILNTDGSKTWTREYYYYVYGQITQYDLGYIQFNCDGSKRIFKIIEDGTESLVLRTTGTWSNGSSGSNVSVTLNLTRVGP